jgi:prepilin-type N-terminal cleavage/methylation domain-containing protein
MSRWTPPDAIDVGRWKARIASEARSESGFTLIELLVAMLISLVVVGSVMWFMIISLGQGNAIESRGDSTIQAQTGLNLLTQDLTEAMGSPQSVTVSETTTTSSIAFDIPNAGSSDAAESVTWSCPYSTTPAVTSAGTCTRQVGGSSAPKEQEMTGIESAAFAPVSSTGAAMAGGSLPWSASNPAYIGITLDVEVASQIGTTETATVRGLTTPIVVKAGVDLRNFS